MLSGTHIGPIESFISTCFLTDPVSRTSVHSDPFQPIDDRLNRARRKTERFHRLFPAEFRFNVWCDAGIL